MLDNILQHGTKKKTYKSKKKNILKHNEKGKIRTGKYLFPAKSTAPPGTLATLRRLRQPMFKFCFRFCDILLVIFCFLALRLPPPIGLSCRPWPTSWT